MTIKSSGEILNEMKTLYTLYQKQVQQEIKGLSNPELARIAYSKSSNWSGGHSIDNMSEQCIREQCIEIIARSS